MKKNLKNYDIGENQPLDYEVDNKKIKKSLKYPVVVLGLVIIGFIGYFGYTKLNPLSQEEQDKKDLMSAIKAVKKMMVIPTDDEPVFATVTDAESLREQQAFFTGAVNGDQLLLFPKSMKAIIYSPTRKMIVNVGPIQQPATTDISNQKTMDQIIENTTETTIGTDNQ